MLEIEVPDTDMYDESTMRFIVVKATKLRFEHSLVSISKWESKWRKPFPFLNKDNRTNAVNITNEEMVDYLRCMCLTQNVNPDVFYAIRGDNMVEIVKYMENPMTATTFNTKNQLKGGGRFVTSELIYFWMTNFNIWKECEKWHINRLMTLIHVCSAENAPKKKMSKNEVYDRQRALNSARRKPKVPKK